MSTQTDEEREKEHQEYLKQRDEAMRDYHSGKAGASETDKTLKDLANKLANTVNKKRS